MKTKTILFAVAVFVICTAAFSQELTVSGTIKDTKGIPIPSVSVVLKGTSKGVVSNFEGSYTIEVNSDKGVLIFSSLGMRTLEVPINRRSNISVTMEEEVAQLQDVVVTALGITKQKKALTYAAQEVSGEEFTRVKDANIINSISGKAAGITVSRSGSGAGGSVKVTIRGNSSTTNNDPLYVIDGVPMLNLVTRSAGQVLNSNSEGGDAVSLINPEDVESMTVLKGASAAALYGNQGSNGVVLITTKSGKEGKTEVKLTSSTFVNGMPYLPQSQNQYSSDSGARSWGAKIPNEKTSKRFTPIPQRFFQTGLEQNTGISVSSGNTKLKNFASFSNLSSTGIIPTNDMNRNSFTIREIGKIFDDKVELDASVSYTSQEIKNRPLSGILFNPLTGVLLGAGDTFGEYNGTKYQEIDPETFLYRQRWPGLGSGVQQNPYWILNNAPTVNKNERLQALASVKYDILSWLNVKGRFNYGRFTTNNDRKSQAGTYSIISHPSGRYELYESVSTQTYADVIATANRSFGDFDLTLYAGGAYKDLNLDNATSHDSGVAFGLNVPNYFNISNFNSSVDNSQTIGDRQQIQSVFGNASISYKKFLYLDASVRTDWSSTLAYTKQLSVTYPSVGVSAVLSEMFTMPDFISLAKIRGSVAQVGNGLSSFLTAPRYSLSRGALSAPSIGPMPGQDLKPEIQTSYEFGTDWAFWGRRLNLGFTFYHNVTQNQYIQVAAPPSNPMGYSQYGINAGSILNQGVEITLGATPIKTQDFSWDTNINFASFNNVVLSLSSLLTGDDKNAKGVLYITNAQGTFNYAYVLKEGAPYGIIQGKQLQTDANGNTIINRSTNAPTIDQNYMDLGQVFPNFTGGWSNTLNYKDLSLNFVIDAKIGGSMMSLSQAAMDYAGTSQKTADERNNGGVSGKFAIYESVKDSNGKDQLSPTGEVLSQIDAQKFYTASQSDYGRNGASKLTTYSATNVLFREVSLGYRFVFKNSKFLKNINAALIGRNLFFIYKAAPVDPNVVSSTGNSFQGLEVFGLPGFRSVGLNLSFTF